MTAAQPVPPRSLLLIHHLPPASAYLRVKTATLCESTFVGGPSNEVIEALFHTARSKDYQELADEIRAALKSLGKAGRIV